MATPQRNTDNFFKVEGNMTEHVDCIQKALEKLQSLSAEDKTETLRSRIDEQSSLICILKQRADELLLRCQEKEGRVTDYQKELDDERRKRELLKKRFMDLVANYEAMTAFMDEHKNQNIQLKLENKQLQSENETLFSQKLQDKEVLVQKLLKEIKELTEKYTNKENDYREKLSACETKLKKQATEHRGKEASLLDQLHDAQQQHREAVEMCKDLKLKLQKAEEEQALKEVNMRESIKCLTKEKDKLLHLSMERGKVIQMNYHFMYAQISTQEKQEEIQQMESKWKKEKKARVEAQERFEREAEAVNADLKVKNMQSALDESTMKYAQFKKDFEAYKAHSTDLLTQERELNKTLRHMTG
ncbi:Coiled-coil domain-containing protein 89 [Collichthys lucidus]|uniref:Coiled-coil domain-containing protein 89 n=1 Tax=Collichthys lucidus TaxID=240159 RepID=A0A4V6AM57_COLLU|nr:Coiled-coil domain-containing protein 89 [Collichthys lucidus]